MNWSEQDLASVLKRRGVPGASNKIDVSQQPFRAPTHQCLALGRLPVGQMNRTEAAYAEHLELLKRSGDVLWWHFEGLKFRLADKTFYSPDFNIMKKGGQLVMHEVKGFMRDDAAVKIKVAASLYPFPFFIVRKGKAGIWNISEVKA